MFKLALNAGHGIGTAGKRCLKSIDPNETREYYLNARICDKIQAILSQYEGIKILRLDDISGQKDISLKVRTDNANAFKADFYLSIHHNAGINGGSGGGVEAYVYLKVDADTLAWQSAFYNAVAEKTGLKGNRSQPLRKADLHECRESNMPCVLLECGYMDSTTDVPIILSEDFANMTANACADTIIARAGLKKKAASAPEAPEAPTQKSVTEIAKEVINGKWGNGEQRRARLTAAGYNYSEVQAEVNRLCGRPSAAEPKKSVDELAREVIKGLWGSGAARKARLTTAGYNAAAVQKRVNQLMKK